MLPLFCKIRNIKELKDLNYEIHKNFTLENLIYTMNDVENMKTLLFNKNEISVLNLLNPILGYHNRKKAMLDSQIKDLVSILDKNVRTTQEERVCELVSDYFGSGKTSKPRLIQVNPINHIQ
jgi:hypothetical protein